MVMDRTWLWGKIKNLQVECAFKATYNNKKACLPKRFCRHLVFPPMPLNISIGYGCLPEIFRPPPPRWVTHCYYFSSPHHQVNLYKQNDMSQFRISTAAMFNKWQ